MKSTFTITRCGPGGYEVEVEEKSLLQTCISRVGLMFRSDDDARAQLAKIRRRMDRHAGPEERYLGSLKAAGPSRRRHKKMLCYMRREDGVVRLRWRYSGYRAYEDDFIVGPEFSDAFMTRVSEACEPFGWVDGP